MSRPIVSLFLLHYCGSVDSKKKKKRKEIVFVLSYFFFSHWAQFLILFPFYLYGPSVGEEERKGKNCHRSNAKRRLTFRFFASSVWQFLWHGGSRLSVLLQFLGSWWPGISSLILFSFCDPGQSWLIRNCVDAVRELSQNVDPDIVSSLVFLLFICYVRINHSLNQLTQHPAASAPSLWLDIKYLPFLSSYMCPAMKER